MAEIAAACHARGVPVLVDGARVPGALALDIAALGVDCLRLALLVEDQIEVQLHAWRKRLWVASRRRSTTMPTTSDASLRQWDEDAA